MEHRRAKGIFGEQLALRHLAEQGYQLLARNYRCRIGEIDLILLDGKQVVFVEVRLKSSRQYGSGFESITGKKISKLRLVAQNFLAFNAALADAEVRFDVISIYDPPHGKLTLHHLKEAF
ncbi:MAG: YraN family protein [Peptococcaceae bacterium]|nr:YraN family protein [Peptococcaceae bacterium]